MLPGTLEISSAEGFMLQVSDVRSFVDSIILFVCWCRISEANDSS